MCPTKPEGDFAKYTSISADTPAGSKPRGSKGTYRPAYCSLLCAVSEAEKRKQTHSSYTNIGLQGCDGEQGCVGEQQDGKAEAAADAAARPDAAARRADACAAAMRAL
eukprot:2545019-Prymnesium_polylepis.2